ncbi:MAG: hypothetical protein KGJ32_05090 [Xanthomonadaceae bacterium]|nr:hypothetical protein [Xanthomonadaceae bacterium]
MHTMIDIESRPGNCQPDAEPAHGNDRGGVISPPFGIDGIGRDRQAAPAA